ncbi:MAG: hypothetical protein JWN04_705 [Myxococcaceae bacterium]|nr:hypothetical protein [Myxococcaceae bacterium]
MILFYGSLLVLGMALAFFSISKLPSGRSRRYLPWLFAFGLAVLLVLVFPPTPSGQHDWHAENGPYLRDTLLPALAFASVFAVEAVVISRWAARSSTSLLSFLARCGIATAAAWLITGVLAVSAFPGS